MYLLSSTKGRNKRINISNGDSYVARRSGSLLQGQHFGHVNMTAKQKTERTALLHHIAVETENPVKISALTQVRLSATGGNYGQERLSVLSVIER